MRSPRKSFIRWTLMTVAVVSLSAQDLAAQDAREAGVVTGLAGTATVAREALTQPAELSFRDNVYVRDLINTYEESLVRLLLGGKALVTIRELSVFTVSEREDRSRVGLASGQLAMAVARERMRKGEVVEIRTPNAIAAVRGTTVIAEVIPERTAQAATPIAATSSTFYVLSGFIDVFRPDDPTNQVRVGVNESVGVLGSRIGRVQALSPEKVAALRQLATAPPQEQRLPEAARKRLMEAQRAAATNLALQLVQDEEGVAAATGEAGVQLPAVQSPIVSTTISDIGEATEQQRLGKIGGIPDVSDNPNLSQGQNLSQGGPAAERVPLNPTTP